MTVVLVACYWYLTTVRAFATLYALGKYPVCEPSAAAVVKVTCPDSDGTCLLVGDNENDTALYLYQLNSKKLISQSPNCGVVNRQPCFNHHFRQITVT